MALVLGSVGVICTHDRRDLVPGLLFGLPTVLSSLLVYVFFIEVELFWIGIFALPSLIIGSLVIWRGFRTGQKRRDYFSALLVCACVYLVGFVLVQCPEFMRVIFFHVMPSAPIL